MYLEVSAEWRLLVVGPATEPSYFERCRRLVQSAGLDGKVLFVGPRDDVPAIARSCDFGVVPSLSESGPLALAEFLAAGIPVVATRVGQISKLTERAGIAGFVEPGDPRALATQLSEVIDLSAAERKRRGELGQRVAREMLDIRESMPDLYKVYSAVGGEDCAC